MTHLAVGYRTLEAPGQGRELKTDGYHNHIGGMDIGSLRVRSRAGHPALTGAGVETIYLGSASGGNIQCYNRDLQVYEDLSINAKNINLVPQGGAVKVSNRPLMGSALLGAYQSGNGWATSQAAVWQETSVTVGPASFLGVTCRVEWSITGNHTTASAGVRFGLGWDGSFSYTLAWLNWPGAGYQQQHGGTFYMAPPGAGGHRLSVFVYVDSGTFTMNGSTYQVLTVTEVGG